MSRFPCILHIWLGNTIFVGWFTFIAIYSNLNNWCLTLQVINFIALCLCLGIYVGLCVIPRCVKQDLDVEKGALNKASNDGEPNSISTIAHNEKDVCGEDCLLWRCTPDTDPVEYETQKKSFETKPFRYKKDELLTGERKVHKIYKVNQEQLGELVEEYFEQNPSEKKDEEQVDEKSRAQFWSELQNMDLDGHPMFKSTKAFKKWLKNEQALVPELNKMLLKFVIHNRKLYSFCDPTYIALVSFRGSVSLMPCSFPLKWPRKIVRAFKGRMKKHLKK